MDRPGSRIKFQQEWISMKLNKIKFISILALLAFSACGGGSSGNTSSSGGCAAANTSCTTAAGPTAIPTSSTVNVPLYIADPSTTGQWTYQNEPVVSVTICTPNHTSSSQCQTITNVLLDTGSYGLRVFGSAIASNVQLTQQTIYEDGETMNLGECMEFGTGADWGAVKKGDVLLGNQTASNISIQVIDPNFASIPSGCAALCPDTDPCTAGFNGILGVGTFSQDCGTDCATSRNDQVNPGIYFGCDSTGCYDADNGNCSSDGACVYEVPTANQVVNPVASFAAGANNGVSLALPSIGSSGASAVTSGILHLGIGTLSSVTVLGADPNGMVDGNIADFTTIFQGTTYGGSTSNPSNQNDPSLAFIDSGSNALFIPSTEPQCSDNPGFYCPGSNIGFSATMEGFSGTPSTSVSFTMGDADALFNTDNSAFNNVCASSQGIFDWGLPFFFGRTVYVGLSGTSATINGSTSTGPYWAF
jgi:hypothetical protein